MRAHDRRAAREIPRFNLTVIRFGGYGAYMQVTEHEGLTEREVEAEKRHMRECWAGASNELSFEVSRT